MTHGDDALTHQQRIRGVACGVAAYTFWGLVPLYFKTVSTVPPLEVLAHRVAWSVVLLCLVVTGLGRWNDLRRIFTRRSTLAGLAASTCLVASNWFFFIYAVSTDQVLEASLGYFINPLVNVALGFVFLRERLRPLQWVSIALAAAGVAILTRYHGGLPLIALALAFSFGLYGLLRKISAADALPGLAAETLLLAPLAVGYLMWLGLRGDGAFLSGTRSAAGSLDLWLPLAGVVTAAPLLWFGVAARRLRLSTVGFLQYIAPTLQFILAVVVFGETFSSAHLAGFGCIWMGLALYSCDTVRSVKSAR